VAAAWMTARRKEGETGIFDFGALIRSFRIKLDGGKSETSV